jgi:predicted 3-demethylubiquinone-9 3-methyltransferase (glyoxalase superfamily)
MQKITRSWFDNRLRQRFYTSIFKFKDRERCPLWQEGRASGRAKERMTVAFSSMGEICGAERGPHFKFSEAVSFVVNCKTQKEVDHYRGNSPRAETKRRSNAAG